MFRHQERRIAAALSGAPANLTRVHRWFPDGNVAPEPSLRLVQKTVPLLVYALWGRLRIRLPGELCELAPGEAVLLAPGVWHRLLDPTAEAIGLDLQPEIHRIRLRCFARDAVVETRLPGDPGSVVLSQLLMTEEASLRLHRTADLVMTHLEAPPDRQSAAPPPPVVAMLAAMDRSLHLGIGAPDLVTASGLATAQAYRLFHATARQSPGAHLAAIRLELAASLLTAGYRIGAVARQCGFGNPVQFSRAWSRHRGYPPREHRRRQEQHPPLARIPHELRSARLQRAVSTVLRDRGRP